MSICALEVLVIIAAPKRAVVHQLQSDMDRHTVFFGYDIPFFVYVVEDSLLEKSISSCVCVCVCTRSGSVCLLEARVYSKCTAKKHLVFVLLFWLMTSSNKATDLQSVCLPAHCHAAWHRSDRAHLCHDSYSYHSPRCPLFSIPIAPMLQLDYRGLAVERRVEMVERRVLVGPLEAHHRILRNLLHGVVGYLLTSRYLLVDLHSGWSCSCH